MSKKHTVLLLLGIAVTCGLIIRFTSEPVIAPEPLQEEIVGNAEPIPEPEVTPSVVTPSTTSTPAEIVPEKPPVTVATSTPEPIVVTPPPSTKGQCRPGGCSGQLCTDKPDMVTTCEWREEYACYQSATCERQPSGECGWTETNELRQCLSSSVSLQAI